MGIQRGPKIITSNLQIALDFGSKRCFSGGSQITGYTQFNNLVRRNNSVGYIKNSVDFLNEKGGVLKTNGAQSGIIYDVGDRIDINTTASGIDRFSGTHNFSIFFWVNQAFNGSYRLMSTGSAGTGTGQSDACIWQMWCDTSQFYWWNNTGGGANNISASGTWHTYGTWEYIGFTYSYNEYSNNIVRCYTDGVLKFSGVTATSTHSYIDRSGQTNLQWTLGGGYSSSCFNANSVAKFGAFHLYNKTLSDGEVLENFNQTKSRYK